MRRSQKVSMCHLNYLNPFSGARNRINKFIISPKSHKITDPLRKSMVLPGRHKNRWGPAPAKLDLHSCNLYSLRLFFRLWPQPNLIYTSVIYSLRLFFLSGCFSVHWPRMKYDHNSGSRRPFETLISAFCSIFQN